MDTCSCGNKIEQPPRGRRRQKCEECSPRRDRPERRDKFIGVQGPDRPSGAQHLDGIVTALVRKAHDGGELAGPGPLTRMAKPAEPEQLGRLEHATLAELQSVGRAETTDGVRVLQVSRLIDAGGYTAQGAAALFKAHREAMAVAMEGSAKPEADIIDVIFGQAQ